MPPSTSPHTSTMTISDFGIDIMELPNITAGNRYVIVLQDFLLSAQWCTLHLAREEVVPFCGIPEAVLSDRETDLFSHLVGYMQVARYQETEHDIISLTV